MKSENEQYSVYVTGTTSLSAYERENTKDYQNMHTQIASKSAMEYYKFEEDTKHMLSMIPYSRKTIRPEKLLAPFRLNNNIEGNKIK